ncbi:MAG: flagellar hook-length control protein FliK [bacterium]
MHKTVIKYQNLTNLLFISGKAGKNGVTPQRTDGKGTTPPHAEFAGILIDARTVSGTAAMKNASKLLPASNASSLQSAPQVSTKQTPVVVNQPNLSKIFQSNNFFSPEPTLVKRGLPSGNPAETPNTEPAASRTAPSLAGLPLNTRKAQPVSQQTAPENTKISHQTEASLPRGVDPQLTGQQAMHTRQQTVQTEQVTQPTVHDTTAPARQPGAASRTVNKLADNAARTPVSQRPKFAQNSSTERVHHPQPSGELHQPETSLPRGFDPRLTGQQAMHTRQQAAHSEPVVQPTAHDKASARQPGAASRTVNKLADNTARMPISNQPRPSAELRGQPLPNTDSLVTLKTSDPHTGMRPPQAEASTPLPKETPLIRQEFPDSKQPDVGMYRPAEEFTRPERIKADHPEFRRPSTPVSPQPETVFNKSGLSISSKQIMQQSEPSIKQTSSFSHNAATASTEPVETVDFVDPAGDDAMQNVPRQSQAGGRSSGGHSGAARSGGSSLGGATSYTGGFNHLFGARAFGSRAKTQNQNVPQADNTQTLAESVNETQPLSTEKRLQQASPRTESTPTQQTKVGRKITLSSEDGNAQKSTMEEVVRQMKAPLQTASSQPRATTPEALQNLANLAAKIRARAQLLNPKGGTIIEAKLSPAGLGIVRIQIEVMDDQMQLRFAADRPEATMALQNSRSDLGAILADHGYNLTQCDVQDQPSQNRLTDMSANSDSQRRQHNPKSSSGKRADQHENQTAYRGMLDYGYNTLELVA